MQFKTALIAHQPDVAKANSDDSALTCLDPSLASQEMAIDSDINYVVDVWVRTGIAPQTSLEALSGDFSNVDDYRAMLDKLNRAKTEFNQLDADVRSFFKNDPANLLAAIDDPAMKPKLQELGIMAKPSVQVPSAPAENPVSTGNA
jgi:Chlamydia-phage Chp2 scaffold (Chlamy_scaf)